MSDCRAVDLVLRNGRPGEIYNIGDGTALTSRELTARLLRQCGADWKRVRQVPDRKGHDRRHSLATRKIRELLGFSPQVPFEQGLADVIRWYRDNRWWWEPLCDRDRHERRAVTAAPAGRPRARVSRRSQPALERPGRRSASAM
jgi:dTDP-glucose 4,6-dehydratase